MANEEPPWRLRAQALKQWNIPKKLWAVTAYTRESCCLAGVMVVVWLSIKVAFSSSAFREESAKDMGLEGDTKEEEGGGGCSTTAADTAA